MAAGSYFDGWIDEYRISNVARWTASFSLTQNMTLVSNATEAEEIPDTVRMVIMEEDVDAITENTDFFGEVSRDNGANWVTITLVDEGDYSAAGRILTGIGDVSGQAADKTMRCRVRVVNNKDCKVHGWGKLWD